MSRLTDAWGAFWGRKSHDSALGFVARMSSGGLPPKRGVQEMLAAYKSSPWLRAVTSKIASTVASTQWQLSVGAAGGDRKQLLRHDLLDLLERPNTGMSGPALRKLTQLYIELTGEAFWLIERGAKDQPVELWPVPPNWVRETPGEGRHLFSIRARRYGEWPVPEGDVIWFRELDPVDPYARGSGMAMSLADELDTDEYAAKRTKAFFYNHAAPETMISAEGMGEEEARRAKERWDSDHRGVFNAFRSFWTGSKITVTRLDTSFKDMQLVELRKFERDIFQQTYGIPPEILGILANSNRATIESAHYLMATNVVVPRLEFLKSELATKLLPQFRDGDRLVLEYQSPVPEDRAFRLQVYQAQPQAFDLNSWRKLAGDSPKPGWDEKYPSAVPLFSQPLASEMPEPLGEDAKRLPAHRRELAPTDVDNVLEALRPERLTAEVNPIFQRRVEKWSKRILRELHAEARFDLLSPLIPQHIEEFSGERIKGVNDTTRDAIREQLAEGVRAGEDVRKLSKRVREVFEVADTSRARTIARTEVVRSSNWATYEAHKVSGVVEARKWVATRDGRTREEHLELDGEEKKLAEPFRVGGASAMYPGGFGVAALDIACRCTTTAVIEDPKAGPAGEVRTMDLDEAWRAFDAESQPWEDEATSALRLGFRAQERDVIDALERLA